MNTVLLASNRGPVSFTPAGDGTLTMRRGGGGLVSGLSEVAKDTGVLWVCAALSFIFLLATLTLAVLVAAPEREAMRGAQTQPAE